LNVFTKVIRMVDRILEVLKYKNLTQSQFADEIGVQRSNISHLLSGRNKPSLEFIQKIIKKFPDINPEYLLSGAGNLTRRFEQTTLEFAEIPPHVVEILTQHETEKIAPEKIRPVVKRKTFQNNGSKKEEPYGPPRSRCIERIVYFYNDQTFKEYFPGKD
jgi:transcriptional regulator with XRE-family HTH domain